MTTPINARLANIDAPRLDLSPMLDRAWLSARWQAAANHQLRLLLRTALDHVTVAKAAVRGGHFDPSRLQLTWRTGADLDRTPLPWVR